MSLAQLKVTPAQRAAYYLELLTMCQYFNGLIEKIGLVHSPWDKNIPFLVNLQEPAQPKVAIGSAHATMRCLLVRKKKHRAYLEKLAEESWVLRGAELKEYIGDHYPLVDDYLVSHQGAWSVYFRCPPPPPDVVELVELMRASWTAPTSAPALPA